ncbi:hypothetical protein [Granulicella arctica]|uniref:Uncharacterized protein n=1 Tax=Granulicella arctica TaxID=940613 RepID=A0A7Y9PI35_9BACT|nr:hypothetical protein [Granulicella arctica]NYF79518.1 hypothetical protein [Granulicella arctica]
MGTNSAKQPDIAAAIDHNIWIEIAIKAIDIVHAKLTRAGKVRIEIRHSQKYLAETLVTTVANRQDAIANKRLQEWKSDSTILRPGR